MNKTLLVIGLASIAGATFILACTLYPPLGTLFTFGKTLFLSLVDRIQSGLAANPITAPIMSAICTGITYFAMRSSASSKQTQIVSAASQERTDILNQAQGALSEQNSQIVELKAKVDALTSQVQETAQLKTEITALQTKLSAAEQRAEQIQAEYNMAVRVKATENSFPAETPAVH